MIEFGIKEPGKEYVERLGAYAVISQNSKIALVDIGFGCFLPGGGVDCGEKHEDALKREVLEETGLDSTVKNYIGKASQFQYSPTKKLYLHKIEHYYIAELGNLLNVESEEDHKLIWCKQDEAIDVLYEDAQKWAVRQFLNL